MTETNETLDVSVEEQTAEKEALVEAKEDDLRSELATEFGFDPDADAEKLDKLVARELKHRKEKSTAIKQKISWRDKATKKSENSQGNSQPNSNNELPDFDAAVSQKVREEFEARDLASLDVPDELRPEIQRIAKMNSISIREAAQDPYIVYKREEFEKEARITRSQIKRGNTSSYVSSDPNIPVNPKDFDLDTEEGREAYQKAKITRKKK